MLNTLFSDFIPNEVVPAEIRFVSGLKFPVLHLPEWPFARIRAYRGLIMGIWLGLTERVGRIYPDSAGRTRLHANRGAGSLEDAMR